jgi:hypothetical protein
MRTRFRTSMYNRFGGYEWLLLLVALGDIDAHLVAVVQDHQSEQGSRTGEEMKGRAGKPRR